MFLSKVNCFNVLATVTAFYYYDEMKVKLCHEKKYNDILAEYTEVPNDMLITVDPRPVVFIFGVDFVFWNFSLLEDTKPPFETWTAGTVIDQVLKPKSLSPNVYNILKELRVKHHLLYLFANRKFKQNTRSLMKKFNITQFFHEKFFIDGTRFQHLFRAKPKCNCEFEDMIYFDSDKMAIDSGRRMSVFSFCTRYGLNYTLLNQALVYYQERRKHIVRPRRYHTKEPKHLKLDNYYYNQYYTDESKLEKTLTLPSSSSEPRRKKEKREYDILEIRDETYIDE